MKRIYIVVILSIVFLSCNCSNYNYAKAVKKDTERIFKNKKSLLQSLAFKGIIVDKNKCEKCNINKFTINIQIEELNQKISFQAKKYLPYYSFDDNVLSLSVSQQVFDKLEKGYPISKMHNSRYLEFQGSQLEILNSKELVWLP
ncbi:MAG: hypothetical protein R2771_16545 [Saprospiraceae bacterium]